MLTKKNFKILKTLSVVLFILFLNVSQLIAVDTGTISEIDVEQAEKELDWYGVTGISITVTVDVKFTVQVSEATPTILFEASIKKAGTSSYLSESGHQSKATTNDTASTIEFEMFPIMISATGKAGADSEISLKKGAKMILSIEMYFYVSGERTTLDTQTKTFYLMSGAPTNWLIVAIFGILILAVVIILVFAFAYWNKRLD